MFTNYILEIKPLYKKSLVISAFALALFTSCNTGKGSDKLSKEDSLKIAENYYQDHPMESKAIITWSKDTTPTTFLTQAEVTEYLERYHKNPALQNDKGTALNGFIFSGDNYKKFITDPRVFGIYVGFASKPNGDFTVMFRGLNER